MNCDILDDNGWSRNKERYELVSHWKTAWASKAGSATKTKDFSKGLFSNTCHNLNDKRGPISRLSH